MCVSVGNKNDDPNSKVVETTDAQKFAEQMGINLFETSAKENVNVEEVTLRPAGSIRGQRRFPQAKHGILYMVSLVLH